MVSVSVSRCLSLAHRRAQSMVDWVICDGGVKTPNRDILAHCVYPGWYSDIEQNTHTHTFFGEKERLTDCRPRLLEGPLFEHGYIRMCLTVLLQCVFMCDCHWFLSGQSTTSSAGLQGAYG
ncbi:hypothetical protein ILYODFUR_029649 [Ilyodon furcidens]|uniref:Uncharacterized protein n=1 Tax=Ilyodon furcidens TaxID=33524 RepID=A0ABV0VIA8_9TELE